MKITQIHQTESLEFKSICLLFRISEETWAVCDWREALGGMHTRRRDFLQLPV